MLRNRLCRATLAFVLAAILLTACGASGSGTSTRATADQGSGEFGLGEPAEPTDTDRVVEIVVTDALAFDPSDIEVTAGETITFRIINEGSTIHDFTIGNQATQDRHEQEMTDMGGMTMADEPNAVTVAAGETKDLTWRFGQSGSTLIGCHQPGHYAGGMTGGITVTA